MSFVHIEPSQERRRLFALWCLEQDPPIQTASASGFDVPLSLYPDIPAEVLEGAYVDGYRLDRVSSQPEAVQASEAPAKARRELSPRQPRKRTARKAAKAQPPTRPSTQGDSTVFVLMDGAE